MRLSRVPSLVTTLIFSEEFSVKTAAIGTTMASTASATTTSMATTAPSTATKSFEASTSPS